MAKGDIISRLKLESGEFDSKIKRAGQELMAYSEHCRKTGLEMGYANKDAKEFAKALGNMTTTATTARGKVSELSDAFVNLKTMYNAMTDAEKQGQFGKNLAASLEQIKQRTQEAKSELADITKELQGGSISGGSGFLSGVGDKMSGALQVFGGNLMTKGFELATSAVTNLVSEVGSCITQGIELARQGEGIRIAFERLNQPGLLDNLKEATHGTVSEIELMKQAIKFENFKLPLEDLSAYLAFAQQKAKDTGESIDFLVTSIVNGLGRQSKQILDNLGISASELTRRMNEGATMTEAVAAIIKEEMSKAGDYVETAADRAAQATTSLTDKMEELGRKFAPLEEASNTFWTSVKISILDVVGGPLADFLNGLTEAGRRMDMLKQMNGGGEGNPSKTSRQLSALRGSNFKNEKYSSQLAQYDQDIRVAEYLKNKYTKTGSMGGGLVLSEISRRFNVKIGGLEDIDNLISSLKTMRSEYVQGAKEIMKPVEANVKTDKAEQNVKTLTTQLKELEKQRKDAVKKGDQEQVESLTKQISQTKNNLGYLDPNTTKTGNGGNKTDIKYADDSIMAQEKLISELTQKWKTASGELRDGYLKQLDEAKAKLKEMTAVDNLPTFTMAELEGTRPKSIDLRGNEGKTQDKLDLATAAFATGGTSNQDITTFISGIKSAIQDANIGSDLYTSLTEKLSDASIMTSVLQGAIAGGVSGMDLSSVAEEMKAKLMQVDISDEAWQEFIDKLNEKIENEDLKLVFDVDSKSIETVAKQQQKDAKAMAKDWKAAGTAIQAVGNAMQQIEDPAAKVLGTIAQAVATMALSYSQAALATAPSGWGWIAFAATGLATMLTSISAIKSATSGFAEGGIVPGNSFSGDNLHTADYGINAGELVLNKAQQGNLASQLEGGGLSDIYLETRVNAEELIIMLNNNGLRRGYGRFIND